MDLPMYYSFDDFIDQYEKDILNYPLFNMNKYDFLLELRTMYLDKYVIKVGKEYVFCDGKKEKLRVLKSLLDVILSEDKISHDLLYKNDRNLLDEEVVCSFYFKIKELFERKEVNTDIGTYYDCINSYKDLVVFLTVAESYYPVKEGELYSFVSDYTHTDQSDVEWASQLIICDNILFNKIIENIIQIIKFIDKVLKRRLQEKVSKFENAGHDGTQQVELYDRIWFKIGVKLATGILRRMHDSCNCYTEVARLLGNESGFRPYISSSLGGNSKDKNKNIYLRKESDLLLIQNYCIENGLEIVCVKFKSKLLLIQRN